MKKSFYRRAAAPALMFVIALLACCGQRALAYNRMGNDRILLMNDDTKIYRNITGQSYTNTNLVDGVDGYYWEHAGTDVTLGNNNLFAGTNHVFREVKNGVSTVLWTVEHAAAGSLNTVGSTKPYIAATGATSVDTIYEWSTSVYNSRTKKWVTTYYGATNVNCEVVFLNTTEAKVYSPYYAEGIGTIYFDAVNAATTVLSHELRLSIATNTLDGAELTAETALSDCNWVTVPVDVFAVENKATISAVERDDKTVIQLKSTVGGGDLFYRVRARLQYFGPIRFKISRATASSGVLTSANDLIDLDNIIASYPVKTVEVREVGEYNDELEGVSVRGWSPAFTVAFPAYGQTGVKGRVNVEKIGDIFKVPEAFGVTKDLSITGVKMHYRWRYLDQIVNDWKTLDMASDDETQTSWTTRADLDLSDGLGDIEYYFEADIYSPYYLFGDYTGCACSGYPDDWSERIKSVACVADADKAFEKSKSIPKKSPAQGRDFFVRLRQGRSPYELVQLITSSVVTNSVCTNLVEIQQWLEEHPGLEPDDEHQYLYADVEETLVVSNDFELIDDHLWRGFLKTPTNHADTVSFCFNGVNATEDGAYALDDNVIHWRSGEPYITANDLPYSGLVESTETNAYSQIEIDAAQGYLMFEFNDEFNTFTVTHADYQNFNLWTDARGTMFVGDASETSGVSRVKTAYSESFTNLNVVTSDSISTNKYWKETFYAGTEENIKAAWQRNELFTSKLSPNGWTCDNGMWASESFNTNNLAFRMAGSGWGSISLQNLTEPMNGVDTFTFKARLSQYLDFDAYSYNVAKINEKNYGVIACGAMSANNGTDMSPECPSISLVAYYRPGVGCYELRAQRIDYIHVKVGLWKWERSGWSMKSTLLTSMDITEKTDYGATGNIDSGDGRKTNGHTFIRNWLSNGSYSGSSKSLYGMYLWVTNEVSTGAAVIGAGISKDKNGVLSQVNNTLGKVYGTVKDNFFNLTYKDAKNPLKTGAYGVGSNDCLARFQCMRKIEITKDGFTGNETGSSELADIKADNWVPAIGRAELVSENTDWAYGVAATVTPQDLKVMLAPAPEGATAVENVEWKDSGLKYTVKTFRNETITVNVHSTSNYFPRLQHGASDLDARTDVTVDDLEIKGYRGVPATQWGSQSVTDWVWTETWLTKGSASATKLTCNFWPDRANPSYPLSLRSPLLDGISMVNFRYKNAQPGVKLLVQIWTNGMEYVRADLPKMTQAVKNDDWVTVDTFTVNAGDPSTGSHTTYISLRSPVQGVVRLVMDPSIVSAAATGNEAAVKKTIVIDSITAWDEPALDEYSWFGWNMRTTDETDRAYLPDPATVPAGLSGALNNSTANTKSGTPAIDYMYHNPFVQSPKAESGIGQVDFKARLYLAGQQPATVSILGASDPTAPDSSWVTLTNIVVDTKSYQSYSWTIPSDNSPYHAVRFSVDGVAYTNSVDPEAVSPQRVLLEELVVAEPISPRVSFSEAMPFRDGLMEKTAVTNLLSASQQPLLDENFGFQAALKLQQLADELDPASVELHVAYYKGASPWGWRKWIDLPETVQTILPPVEGTNLVFRSSYDVPESVVMPIQTREDGSPNVVQYHMWATYRKKGEDPRGEPHRHDLEEGEWTHGASAAKTYSYPSWYWPKNFNAESAYGDGKDDKFSAYTLLDTVSPYRAWINEVNLFDNELSSSGDVVPTNQFIEVAVPAGADLTGWYVTAQNLYEDKQMLFEFGNGSGVAASKVADATNRFAFITVASPNTRKLRPSVAFDGTWNVTFPMDSEISGQLVHYEPYGFELVRPSGVIEQQIVVVGTNVLDGTSFSYFYEGTNFLADVVKRDQAGSTWTFNGKDLTRGTLGAMATHGEGGLKENGGTWEVDLMPTEGQVNRRWDGTCEEIDPNWYLEANGMNVWLFATVLTDHLSQKSGLFTDKTFRTILPSGCTTNIEYVADAWWRIGSLTTNGVPVPEAVDQQRFTLTLERMQSNVEVVAKADVWSAVTKGAGLDADGPYRDEVINWLEQFDEKAIKLAWYYNATGTERIRQLSLTEMYWLDIPPTEQCQFWAGLVGDVRGVPVTYYNWIDGQQVPVTNTRVQVSMLITNLETRVAWPPNCLQTVGNRRSDVEPPQRGEWPGVTFKVEAALLNLAPDNWIPLRFFVFDGASFPSGGPQDHTVTIELWDPFDTASPTYEAGWSRYRFSGNIPVYRWNIGDSRIPNAVEVLRPESVYISDSP